MLREIADALESITAETALLLVLEDPQWVDDSTVDLISALARRRTLARLMLLASTPPPKQSQLKHLSQRQGQYFRPRQVSADR
jgi:predicted ATPase